VKGAAANSAGLPSVPSLRRPVVVASAVVAACAVWAFWPMPREQVEAPSIEPVATPQQHDGAPAPLDLAAFNAPLWVAPPPLPPPAPVVAAPPKPPLKLQLIAIVREGEARKAAIYDPDQDRLFIVGKGDSIAGRVIEEVRASDLTLTDNGAKATLALREGDK
jgi:hypothetical protein